jgi:hypothetical protein
MNKNNHKYMSFSNNRIPAWKIFSLWAIFCADEIYDHDEHVHDYNSDDVWLVDDMADENVDDFDNHDAEEEEQYYYQAHYHDDRDDAYDSSEYDR